MLSEPVAPPAEHGCKSFSPSSAERSGRQVWSGTEEQGNNQVNIFKDTGYLVTSTVDGYNVCIFAYGQVCKPWKK